jgi:hypothetical protein
MGLALGEPEIGEELVRAVLRASARSSPRMSCGRITFSSAENSGRR